MKYIIIIKRIIISLAISFNLLKSQDINLEGEIYEYATYYVNSFDFNTGATNVQIFRYTLSSSYYPVQLKVMFRASMVSPSLGINSEQIISEVLTDEFQLNAPLILDNRDISASTTTIYDMDSPPNAIQLGGQVTESLDPSQADAILQSVLATGRIADGEYTFAIEILSENDQVLASDTKTIIVESPSSIDLESPGGAISDTSYNVIYTSFPVFQWFAQTGNGYNTYIRVAEFNSSIHNSIEDALEDQRMLPFGSNEDWFPIANDNSFQYPYSGAGTLEEDKVYGWQIKVEMPTTSGAEEMLSSAFAFKIGTSGSIETINQITNPFLLTLEEALGSDQFNALFGDGNELQGYVPSGQFEVNGVTVDQSSVGYLLNQIINNDIILESINVE